MIMNRLPFLCRLHAKLLECQRVLLRYAVLSAACRAAAR